MLANRVKETTSTTGTGSFTTTGAASNFQTFNTAFGTNKRFVYWAINDTDNEWETGIGYLSASTTLVRETVQDNHSDAASAVNFTTAPTLYAGPNELSLMHSVAVRSGLYICSSNINEISGTNNYIDANEIHYIAFHLACPGDYDAFEFNLTAASGNIRMGLYDWKAGLPHNLIAVHDTSFDISSGSGSTVLTFDGGSQMLCAGWYCIGVTVDGTPSFSGVQSDSHTITPFGHTGGGGAVIFSADKTRTYAAMPNTADVTSLTYVSSGQTNMMVTLRQG